MPVVLLLTACGGVEGLKSEDIFGRSPHPKVWLYGLVTNARSGASLSQVSIQVEGFSTASDANGAYRIDGLQVQETSGSASAQGFQVQTVSLNLRPGANSRDIALEPQGCGPNSCASNELCDVANGACLRAATLSGIVVSDCTGEAIDARVTIDGKSTCSTAFSGKAFFQLRNLTPGGPQLLAVGKTGYQAFSTQVTLQAGFNAIDPVRLVPIGGCASGNPANEACTCTQSYCQ